jgi:hypothetical protein
LLVDLIEPNTVFEPRLNQVDLRLSRILPAREEPGAGEPRLLQSAQPRRLRF